VITGRRCSSTTAVSIFAIRCGWRLAGQPGAHGLRRPRGGARNESPTKSALIRTAMSSATASASVNGSTWPSARGTCMPLRERSTPARTTRPRTSVRRGFLRRPARIAPSARNTSSRRAPSGRGRGWLWRCGARHPRSARQSVRPRCRCAAPPQSSRTGPVRSLGPGRSTRMPTVRSSAPAAARAVAACSACNSGVACAAFRRTTSTPAWSRALSASGSDVAGPIVRNDLGSPHVTSVFKYPSATSAAGGAESGNATAQAQIRRAGGRRRIGMASVRTDGSESSSPACRKWVCTGCSRRSRNAPQPFRVDLELLVDLAAAGVSERARRHLSITAP